jgi:MurNAc alpha-1-phosphate uridylyltransferase
MLPVAILCGGLGTRMRSIAAEGPKALISVGGDPFIYHQLRWLAAHGIADVVLCVGFGADVIRGAVGDGTQFGLNVAYSDDGEHLRGTAGSLAHALPFLGARFLVMYGDSLLQCDPIRVAQDFVNSDAAGLMTVLRNDDRWLPSNVRVEDSYVVGYDKKAPLGTMTHIDYGLNAFSARSFADIDSHRPVDLADVHTSLVRSKSLRAFTVIDRFYEIGSPQGLAETERFLAEIPSLGGQHGHLR